EIADVLRIRAGDEIVFENKDGKIIVSSSSKPLSSEELDALKKIGLIRHYERTADSVGKAIGEKALELMMKKKILFKYKKEGKELIGVDKTYFPLITEKKEETHPLIEKLFSDGFLIIDDASAATFLTNELMRLDRAGDVRGVRGFDKKFYIVTSDRMRAVAPKIEKALKSEKVLKDVAEAAGVSADLCKAVIEVMKEDGDVVEKKENVFARA
ncbi:MAG: hypothetical protein QXO69_01510, partial [archaeon]